MDKVLQEKVHNIDAILSLITTAEKWLNTEFPSPSPGVECESMVELHNQLGKSQKILENLLVHYRTADMPIPVQE